MLVTFFVKIKLLKIYFCVHRFWEWNYFWNSSSLVTFPLSMWHSDLSKFLEYLTARRFVCHPSSILLYSIIILAHVLIFEVTFDTVFRWRFGVIPSWQAQIVVKKSELMKCTPQLKKNGQMLFGHSCVECTTRSTSFHHFSYMNTNKFLLGCRSGNFHILWQLQKINKMDLGITFEKFPRWILASILRLMEGYQKYSCIA